jgi:hypothetical protein
MAHFDRRAQSRRAAVGAWLFASVTLTTVTGCAATLSRPTGSSGASTGTLIGTVRTYGGPQINATPAADGRPNAGLVVRFERDGQTVRSATTDGTGRFTVTLPAGDYAVDACGWGKPTDHVTIPVGSIGTHDFRCDVP